MYNYLKQTTKTDITFTIAQKLRKATDAQITKIVRKFAVIFPTIRQPFYRQNADLRIGNWNQILFRLNLVQKWKFRFFISKK